MTHAPASARVPLPHQGERWFVTDGGLETDLIFHHGLDLPCFAAYPLLDTDDGRALLGAYFDAYATIAGEAGAGLILETPTWRANPDWAAQLGTSAADLDRINRFAVSWLAERRRAYTVDVDAILIGGTVGPRGDGYVSAGAVDPDEAERYHSAQIASFAAAGADLVSAYTLTEPGEAIGIVRAARSAGIPVAVSFTVETDGRLVGGASLAEAIEAVDAAAAPDYFLVNCAHPSHIANGLTGGDNDGDNDEDNDGNRDGGWRQRIVGVRSNASTKSHAELDEAVELDEGDTTDLAAAHGPLRTALPSLRIIGGCCGTDARHVAALWGVDAAQLPKA